MPDDSEPTHSHRKTYLAEAARIRALAQDATSDEARAQMQQIADMYEKLAGHLGRSNKDRSAN